MRLRLLSLPSLLLATAALAVPAPPIDALKDFRPGQWQMKLVGGPATDSRCIADPQLLLTGGRPASECTFSLIASQPHSATVTYRCSGGRSGRTEIRRDAHGIYAVASQGLEGGLPFAARTEWRRTGDC
jgi:hypothetical protein